MQKIFVSLFVIFAATPVNAETVCVKYGPCPLELSPFVCSDVASSFIRRVCYDASNSFMVIELNTTWYPYCAIGADVVQALIGAVSPGTYYNQSIRSNGGQRGPFDCRDHPLPKY